MARGLSPTWIIIRIGKKEYAINSKYVKAITELKHETFIAESAGTFVRGIYNIFNTEIPVLDGYKIARETSLAEYKLNFSKRMTDAKIVYMSWLDTVEWMAMYVDPDGKWSLLEMQNNIENWTESTSFPHDDYLNKLYKKLIDNINITITMANKLVDGRLSKRIQVSEAIKEIEEIRRHAKRYILDAFDNLIDYYTSKISEMCVIVEAGKRNFGVCIDSVELISETPKLATGNKRTKLSAGTIEIKSKVYNVIDLTKLSKVIP